MGSSGTKALGRCGKHSSRLLRVGVRIACYYLLSIQGVSNVLRCKVKGKGTLRLIPDPLLNACQVLQTRGGSQSMPSRRRWSSRGDAAKRSSSFTLVRCFYLIVLMRSSRQPKIKSFIRSFHHLAFLSQELSIAIRSCSVQGSCYFCDYTWCS